MTSNGMTFSKRDIIVIEFPYSGLLQSKKRPVLILGEKGDDFIVCAITSNPAVQGVPITFEQDSLPLKSTIKYWQIQTILKNRVERKLARVTKSCFQETLKKIQELFRE
ncbi:type II toxin-antitoxin system PemK/MazF family toxin [Candidatus Woesearchaeota archaeon]|nr:type II toxin-antitoxin system PemK/MazF family toxin [Candidatus Woesearchaeota archaeon]